MVCMPKDSEAVIACSHALLANPELLGQMSQDSREVIRVLSEVLGAQGFIFTQEILVAAQRRIEAEEDRNDAQSRPVSQGLTWML